MFQERIAVAMSGGTDSSAVAAMLVDEGREVIGLTAHMWKDGSRCCSIEDVERARKVASFLGIMYFVLNASEMFSQEVVDPFVAEYVAGRTPSPCITCNKRIKFGFLLTRAVEFDCTAMATGHYARIVQRDGEYHLLRAKDASRDQSYFLHRLSQRQLAHVRFPLGDLMKKRDVLPFYAEHAIPIPPREESQDLCFVPPSEYGNFIESRAPDARKEGAILNQRGETVGTHQGVHRFTIGQRRGLGSGHPSPMYVTKLDVSANSVTIGPREASMSRTCDVSNIHWVSGHPPGNEICLDVRIRYKHDAAPARIAFGNADDATITFNEPQFAITPGQAAVFYMGDEVMGGGWINS